MIISNYFKFEFDVQLFDVEIVENYGKLEIQNIVVRNENCGNLKLYVRN